MQPTRRRVLKASAWTAPAIVLATAAPAMAASGQAVTTQVVTVADNATNLPMTVNFFNPNTVAVAPLTLVVAVSFGNGATRQWSGGNATGLTAGWTQTGNTGDAVNRTYTFTNAAGVPAGNGLVPGTASVNIQIPVTGGILVDLSTGNVVISASSPGTTITGTNSLFL